MREPFKRIPALYRKKPVVIEARQFTEANGPALRAWMILRGFETAQLLPRNGDIEPSLVIPTLEGDMRADLGDWIIRGVKGEFYPCKPDVFEQTYEKVEE